MEENRDTTYYIWEILFRCRVPQLQTTSAEYIRHFGVPSTGIPEYDKSLANQLIDTAISIVKMVEYFKKGIPVYIVQQKDVKTIYEYIENHIHAWKNNIQKGVHIGNAPIDDLIAMDQFANKIYEHAKYNFTKEMADSLLLRQISGVMSVNKFNIIKPVEEEELKTITVNAIEEDQDDGYAKRESFADLFKNRKVGDRKWR